MSCSCPITGWRSQNVNPTGKRSIVFQPREGFIDMPVELPCGRCVGCRADQALMWSIRAYHESLDHQQNCFITLTYSDEHLPDDGKIDKRSLQLFFKRLRKAVAPAKLRYIACGEYGEQTRRPHYHAVIFGLDFLDARRVMISDTMYTHPVLQEAWPYGQVAIDEVSFASICYTCGYVVKKIADEDTFSLMSRRPGIGKNWLNRFYDDLVRTGVVVIEGREFAIPTRYLIWREDELAEVKRARAAYAKSAAKRYDPVERRRRTDARQLNRRALINQKGEKL